jgi:hypothetical protein
MPDIRIGIVLDGPIVPSWIAAMLREIRDSAGIQVALFAPRTDLAGATTAGTPAPCEGLAARATRRWLDGYRRRLFDRHPQLPPSQQPTDIADMLADIGQREISWRPGDEGLEPSTDDLAWLAALELDVLLDLGASRSPAALARLARCGLWQLLHGDAACPHAPPAGLVEVMHSRPITSAALQMLDPRTLRPLLLSRTHACTVAFSAVDNAASIHWNALSLPTRQIARLRKIGGERFLAQARDANREPRIDSAPCNDEPGLFFQARQLLALTLRKTQQMTRGRLFLDQWSLLYRFSSTSDLDLRSFKRLVPPPDRIWADPFPYARDGRYYIFFEEMPLESSRGHIAVVEVFRNGQVGPRRVALETPYHLSYPFLFEFEGELYMIPESAESGRIELYRCTGFPDQWEFVHALMEGVRAYDSTLLQRDGRWWMFATMVGVDGASSWNELFVFSADSPLSQDWVPHPENPVVSDCRSARPAGAFFELEGALYRPSQDSSHRYGYGFNIARVDALDPTSFEERIVARAEPHWCDDVVATHTFNRCADLQVIDAQIRRRR